MQFEIQILKKVSIVFHNGSIYDYHFIVKQLAEDFKGQFECLGENTKKYINFSVPIKKDDNSNKITDKLKFIDSYRFMQSKLPDLIRKKESTCIYCLLVLCCFVIMLLLFCYYVVIIKRCCLR